MFICYNRNEQEALPDQCSQDGVTEKYLTALQECAQAASGGLYGNKKLLAWDWGRPRRSASLGGEDGDMVAGCPSNCVVCNKATCRACCLVYDCTYCSGTNPPSSCPQVCSFCEEEEEDDPETCMADAIADHAMDASTISDYPAPSDMEQAISDACSTQIRALTRSMNYRGNYCFGISSDVDCTAIIYPKPPSDNTTPDKDKKWMRTIALSNVAAS